MLSHKLIILRFIIVYILAYFSALKKALSTKKIIPIMATQLACLRWPNVGIGWQRRRRNSNVGPTLGKRKLIVG